VLFWSILDSNVQKKGKKPVKIANVNNFILKIQYNLMDYFKIGIFSLGIIAVIGFFNFIGFSDMALELRNARLDYILYAFFLQILIMFLLSLKLRSIANNQGQLGLAKGKWTAGKYRGLGILESFRITLIGTTIGFLTPIARLGGEPVKIFYLKKNDIPTATSAAIMAIDAFTEVFSYYIIVIFSIGFVLLTGRLPYVAVYPFLLILAVSTALLLIFLLMCFSYKIMQKTFGFAKWVAEKVSQKLSFSRKSIDIGHDPAKTFSDVFRPMMTNQTIMLKIMSYSFFIRLLEFIRMYMIFLAFTDHIEISTIIVAWSIILLVGMLPLLPGGLGSIEAGGTYAFIIQGVAKPVAGAAIFIDRMASFWFVMLLGMIAMLHDSLRRKLIRLLDIFLEAGILLISRIRNIGKKDFGKEFQ
jgi:uncharacterized protein (TIRG00374 family)